MKNPSFAKAFTLIELLVVIAIIAILAAILFPVFAQAKAAAKSIVCVSQQKQIALAAIMYSNDYDDNVPPDGVYISTTAGVYATTAWWFAVSTNYNTTPISATYDIQGGFLQPYMKSAVMQGCPSATNMVNDNGPGGPPMGIAVNMFGTAGQFYNEPGFDLQNPYAPALSSFDAPASTIMLADQGILYGYPGDWSDYARNELFQYQDDFLPCIQARHNGRANVAWFDGHVHSQAVTLPNAANYPSLASWTGYYAGDQQDNVGLIFPPGVSSATDPRSSCYFLPVDGINFANVITLSRPSTCPD